MPPSLRSDTSVPSINSSTTSLDRSSTDLYNTSVITSIRVCTCHQKFRPFVHTHLTYACAEPSASSHIPCATKLQPPPRVTVLQSHNSPRPSQLPCNHIDRWLPHHSTTSLVWLLTDTLAVDLCLPHYSPLTSIDLTHQPWPLTVAFDHLLTVV